MKAPSLDIVVAVNNEPVFDENLLRSPVIRNGQARVHAKRGFVSAGAAYNAGLASTTSPLVAFVHQDVYLPSGWERRLMQAAGALEAARERWGLLGIWGVRANGPFVGRVWCTGGGTEHSGPLDGIVEVASIDEVVIVVNTAANLRFDERLPGFHLYATDIALEAKRRGLKTFVFNGPVVHNSRTHPRPVNEEFARAYRYMQKKWASLLPAATCVVPITRFGWPLTRRRVLQEIRVLRHGMPPNRPPIVPQEVAARLGYEMPTSMAGLE
jgi:hypothetical protein